MEESILCECETPKTFEDENGINFCTICKKESELLRKPKCNCEKSQPNYPEMVWCDNCNKEI
jgi:hypothetical protein